MISVAFCSSLQESRDGMARGRRAEEKWGVMRMALVDTALELLGKTSRRRPDWFHESEDIILPFLQARNKAYTSLFASSGR